LEKSNHGRFFILGKIALKNLGQNSHNNAINTDEQKRRCALLSHAGYGER